MKKGGMFSLAALVSIVSISSVSAAFNFVSILDSWYSAGVFSTVIPFLLVFALVYGILAKAEIFGKNAAVDVIVALALGLLSLVSGTAQEFFQKLAPNLAIGLSVLLAAIILLGLFVKDEKTKWIQYIFVGVGILAFIFVLFSSMGNGFYDYTYYWDNYGPAIITLVVMGLVIGLIVWAGKNK